MARTVSVLATECTQNNRTFYSTVISSEILKQICFISRRDEDPQKGFQRLLNKSRARNIASYLDEHNGVIPSAIILSAQDKAKLNYNKDTSKIVFTTAKDSFLVIDGQHRLYGLLNAKEYYEIPVIIFNKLTSNEEVRLFIDINTTQKGVPSALILDIKQLAGIENKLEERQRELFDLLNKKSPIAGLLSPAKSQTGKISRNAFNEATAAVLKNSPLSEEDSEIVYKGVKNYLEAVEYVLIASKSPNAKLTKAVIFKAIFAIIDEVLRRCLQEFNNLKTDSLKQILDPISTLPFDDYTGTNRATIERIVTDMRNELNKNTSIQRDMF